MGYYIRSEDRLASFLVSGDKVEFRGFSEVFKHPEQEGVNELDISLVKIGPEKAVQVAESLQSEEYPADKAFKKVVILQNLDVGLCYNITFITQNFKTLNIKVSASSGEVVSHKEVDLIQIAK